MVRNDSSRCSTMYRKYDDIDEKPFCCVSFLMRSYWSRSNRTCIVRILGIYDEKIVHEISLGFRTVLFKWGNGSRNEKWVEGAA